VLPYWRKILRSEDRNLCKYSVISVNTTRDEHNDQAADETGPACKGSECHFLNKLRQLHEDNVRRTDDELGGDGMEVKLGIS
jgi:hypothetical protein